MGETTRQPEQPLSAAYDFTQPGGVVTLFEGILSGPSIDSSAGRVEFHMHPHPRIEWTREPAHTPGGHAGKSETLTLHDTSGLIELAAWVRNRKGGWSNGNESGERDAPTACRLIAHWLNLPFWIGSTQLFEECDSGAKSWWTGRSRAQLLHWQITIDSRSDRQSFWRNFHERDIYSLTHIMEIVRNDGSSFAPTEAYDLLAALHISVSFAMGRWAAPVLPVAYDPSGNEVWKEWRPLKCDRGKQTGIGWWYESDFDTLSSYLSASVPALLESERSQVLKTQMLYAIAAASENALLEQRIMTAAAGLEHLSWNSLVLSGEMSPKHYRQWTAADRLRRILQEARIPFAILMEKMPASLAFAKSELTRTGDKIDGPEMIARVRNRLVHPKDANDSLRDHEGLLVEVWLLSKYYLELLILQSIGFQGHIRDMRTTDQWAGTVVRAPWARADGSS